MNFDIKLYVHGVPHGQSIWGNPDFDRGYVESFYGRKSDVPVLMVVEVLRSGSAAYCYYTYFCTGNFLDCDNRPGAYFALTLRLNYYYEDVKNMFNILNAAYEKFIVGEILDINQHNNAVFKVSDFTRDTKANSVMTALSKELVNYLMQFSRQSDFSLLNDYRNVEKKVAPKISFSDAGANLKPRLMKYGRMYISPMYPSMQEKAKIEQLEAEHEQKIKDVKVRFENEKQGYEKSLVAKNQELSVLKNNVSALTNNNSKLQGEIKEKNNKLLDMQKELSGLSKSKEEISKLEGIKTNLEGEIKKRDEKLGNIRKALSDLNNMVGGLKPKPNPEPNPEIITNPGPKPKKKFSLLQKLHSYFEVVVVILLLLIILLVIPKGCGHNAFIGKKSHSGEEVVQMSTQSQEDEVQKPEIDIPDEIDESPQTTFPESATQNETSSPSAQEKGTDKYSPASEYRIDIEGVSPQRPMYVNRIYPVHLKDGKKTVSLDNGKWEGEGFRINGDKITPMKTGRLTISYVFGSHRIVASRELEVIEMK